MKKILHYKENKSTYLSWSNMKTRCYNKKCVAYPRYGGRGITVCDKWQTIEGFVEDMGLKPDGLTLERIDCSKGYCKENCKWATYYEQSNNRPNYVRQITHNGVTDTLTGWSRRTGLKVTTLYMRLYKYGWDINKALTK